MNDFYDNDSNCNQSNSAHITVQTYEVIPISTKLGIIEWLDNTRPLKEFIEANYAQAKHDIISQAKPTTKSTSNTIMYAELFISLTKAQVQDEFNKIQSVTPSDLLRRAYYKMTNSYEGFDTLRRQFITSFAVLCTSHYILSIGDRHQSNSDLKLNNFLHPSNLKEALGQMEKVVDGDQTQNKRTQILMQYKSNRCHKLTVDE
ncbi:unnamed protein product [Rotaria sp. Silwood2]|nr:unnamed protein product [Rotaria sp. Silwood2]CAF3236209.1 unnamed protein product [Rotaria sp. Silwood2]CAF4103799.1 unnamed protein product [Rotaria sp. Silwood2]CAF4350431.1 unnamed protein product [Rotaria sp. Silwood2]CAF4521327.1 unnamed protein product [Rotaria sp. Silwood2]